MDRIIVYPGAIPLDTDMLNTNRNVMIALHALISATLGTTTAVDGLAVTATVPASMQVTVGQGSLTQYGMLDASSYGSLPADTTDQVVKMGVMVTPQTFTLTTPTTAGTSIAYLIEACFNEIDDDPVVLPYYNAANPTMPYLGPGNTGAAQMTLRQQLVSLQLKAGAAAPTGIQTVPPVDPGYVGLATVVVGAGATQVTQANIVTTQTTRFTPWKLPDLTPGYAFSQAFTTSGTFTVPDGVTRLRATVIGGGGAGGSCATAGGAGGGGAGARGLVWLTGVTPGTQIPVTVGSFGVAAAGAAGAPGSTSSFGIFCSATGGFGGQSSGAGGGGGGGGTASGANVYYSGESGVNAAPGVALGGAGGGPGGGVGGAGNANGANAVASGGGGGGASGNGFNGGSGGGGMVVVEW